MMLIDPPATIFSDYNAAAKVCALMDPKEYRIDTDPKGSGRCLIRILDEETGEVLGSL